MAVLMGLIGDVKYKIFINFQKYIRRVNIDLDITENYWLVLNLKNIVD